MHCLGILVLESLLSDGSLHFFELDLLDVIEVHALWVFIKMIAKYYKI